MRQIQPDPKPSSVRTAAQAQPRFFYGWWMVAACAVVALISNALALYGASVYLHAAAADKGWTLGLISGAITLFYVVSALLLVVVGDVVGRLGPRPVITFGAVALASGVAGVGSASEPWQVYAAFIAIGFAWACLSLTAVTTTLAPWFERHQGRATSIASLGASAGGIGGVPALMFGIEHVGFQMTTMAAALVVLAVLLPLGLFVLRRRPEDLGLLPDGEPPRTSRTPGKVQSWRRADAIRTVAFRSVVVTFGIGMMVQVGFLTHHVALAVPSLGPAAASATVATTAAMALIGRLLLAKFADHLDVRITAGAVLLLASAALSMLALFPSPGVLIVGSALYGLTVGNVTTLSPIIVRREFGAASFGAVYGAASTAIWLSAAMGPAFYGYLHDAFGSYTLPLLVAAALDLFAAAVVMMPRWKSLQFRS